MNDLPVLSSAAQIRGELKRRLVPVPQWGYACWVSELTGGELDAYRQKMYKIDGAQLDLNMENNTLRLLALALRDASNNRLFPDTEQGVTELKDKPAGGLEVLAKAARQLSGLSDEDKKATEGNSEAGQTGGSSSDSPATSVEL